MDEVDASLVQMYFAADRRSEWIYRGSTRLKPLYNALVSLSFIYLAVRQRISIPKQPQNM